MISYKIIYDNTFINIDWVNQKTLKIRELKEKWHKVKNIIPFNK